MPSTNWPPSLRLVNTERGETIIEEGTQHDLLLMHAGRARLVLRRENAEDLNVVDIEAGEAFGVLSESPVSDRALVVAINRLRGAEDPSRGIGPRYRDRS